MALDESEIREPQIAETGGVVDGEPVTLDRRLFVQLLAYGGCDDSAAVIGSLSHAGIPAVVYEDVNDDRGVALAVPYEDPSRYLTELRPALSDQVFSKLDRKHELTMFGRTYAVGYERDLYTTLLAKPISRLQEDRLAWAVWYPLRRRGLYETLTPEEQHEVQGEHMRAGIAFARAGHIADIRLACHGLGQSDNDFIVGLFGPILHRLSLAVQHMRKSVQTSTYLESLGPFFIGRVAGRTPALMELE